MGRPRKGAVVGPAGKLDAPKSLKAENAVKAMKVMKRPSIRPSIPAPTATNSTQQMAMCAVAKVITEIQKATKSAIAQMDEQGYWELHRDNGSSDFVEDKNHPMIGKLVVIHCHGVANHHLGGIVNVHQWRGTSSEDEAVYEVRYEKNEMISLDRHEFWLVRSVSN